MAQNDEKHLRCRASVFDKYSEEDRPCMRVVGKNKLYCWQHSSSMSRRHGARNRSQGTRGWYNFGTVAKDDVRRKC